MPKSKGTVTSNDMKLLKIVGVVLLALVLAFIVYHFGWGPIDRHGVGADL